MQDRFKFRAINMQTKEITYIDSYYWFEENGVSEIDHNNTGSGSFAEYWINQCTGLKDKNGKLIYEGDILRYPPENKDEEKNYVACEVFFHNNDCCDNHIGFQMNRYHFQGCLCGIVNYGTRYKFIPKNTERMEVIGNIYENSELLNE